jgi:hypothetical protein
MSEDLFRLCVIRSPLAANPRYPPIPLAQDSPFQVTLGTAVSNNPDDPRQGLEGAANTYSTNSDFTGINPDDTNNKLLLAATNAIQELIDTNTPDDTEPPQHEGEASPKANHDGLLGEMKKALSADNLSSLSVWFDPLAIRLKNSILALRLLGFEQETGVLALLTTRLRTIEVVRKVQQDVNFPLDALDLQKYSFRSVLAPTFAELKSILSTANARLQAEGVAEAKRKADQDRIAALFVQRQRITDAMKDVIRLPNTLRTTIKPIPFAPTAPAIDLSAISLVTQHLDLAKNLSNLTLKSFEKGLDSPVVIRSTMREAAPDTVDASGVQNFAIANPLVNMSKTLLDTVANVAYQPKPPPALPTTQATPFALQPDALTKLNNNTLSVFKDLAINVVEKPVDVSINQLNQELRKNGQDLDAVYSPYTSNVAKVQLIGGSRLQYLKPAVSPWLGAFLGGLQPPGLLIPFSPIPRLQGRVNILGVADLLVVKQQLIRYEGGDVAYIENVLRGETRRHEVNTITSQETDITTEIETTDSQETDTTTAERFEVSNESDKTIKEDASTKAGVTVSASYGPTVSVSANASFSNDRSNTEATKEATRYSKEVTSKAVDKITKRVLQRTVTKTRTETSTKDVHSFINTPTGSHIAGIYQWQNKIYEAQTWNYGKRTMLDFMIPEPGAFYLDKQTDPDDNTNTIMMVPPFTASPETLDAKSYTGYAVQYGVTDITGPPAEMTRATASYAAGKDEPHAKADKIVIPAGFQVTGISVTATGVSQLDKNQNWVMVTCVSMPTRFAA